MIDQSSVKIFVLLMEQEQDHWIIPVSRLKKYSAGRDSLSKNDDGALTYPEFLKFEGQKKVDMVAVFKSLCSSFPIFDFIFDPSFQKINNESIVLIRNNQDFLQQIYDSFAHEFLDPIDLAIRPEGFQRFVDGFARFGFGTDLCPNLVSLKELLLLVVYVKRYRELNVKEAKEETAEEAAVFTFEEFKTLLVILNKYLLFKFREIYDLYEETYLSNLLWYIFLKAANNEELNFDPKMRVYNDKMDENIFYQLNKVDLRSDKDLEAGIVDNFELLFLVFANNFSLVGNPQLTLDPKALLRAEGFRQHAEWIRSYIDTTSGKADFNSFLEVLTKVVSVRKQNISKESEFRKFVQDNAYNLNAQMLTNYEYIPRLRDELNRKIKRLFVKYAVDSTSLFVMDFVFLCKEFGIIPNQYSNKHAMTLFFQANIRELSKRFRRRADFLAQRNFFYIDLDTFVKLLVEIAEHFLGGALQMDFEGKLELLFSKIIRG